MDQLFGLQHRSRTDPVILNIISYAKTVPALYDSNK